MARGPLTFVVLCLATQCTAQFTRNNEIRPFLGAQLNFQVPDLVSYTTPRGSAIPGIGGGLEAGVSLTHLERWGLALSGSVAEHGYLVYLDTSCWSIYHQAQRAEGRAWWLFPFGPLESAKARIGLAFGTSFQNDSDRRTDEEGFFTRMVGEGSMRTYMAPEVGFTRAADEQRLEFGVRYLYHFNRTPAWTSHSTSAVGEGMYTGTDDHLALVFRYHFAIPRPVIELPSAPDIHFNDRENDTLVTLSTHRPRIIMALWDDAEHDGDTISVFLNGRAVLVGHELTPKHFRLPVDLEHGTNRILVVAHNEGRVPPNTARAFVRTGNKGVQLLVKTGEHRNTSIIIDRE